MLLSGIMIIQLPACVLTLGDKQGSTVLEENDEATLEQAFIIGTTTSRDVLLKLGPPDNKYDEAGMDIWEYSYHRNMDIYVALIRIPIGTYKRVLFYFKSENQILDKMDYKNE